MSCRDFPSFTEHKRLEERVAVLEIASVYAIARDTALQEDEEWEADRFEAEKRQVHAALDAGRAKAALSYAIARAEALQEDKERGMT